MVNVRGMVTALERSSSHLSDDLKNFLDLVWTQGYDHRTKRYHWSHSYPYRIYSKQMGNFNHTERSMNEFLRDILTMPQLPEVQCPWYNENSPLTRYLRNFYMAKKVGFAKLDRTMFTEMVDDARVNPELNKLLSKTFYHFRQTRGTRSLYRIYLNVRPLVALRVMRFILTDIVRKPREFPHICNAKVSAPGKKTRADSIIIYFSQEDAMDRVLDAIADYQKSVGHNYFEHGSPRMTKSVTEYRNKKLKGVGIGAEPPFNVRIRDEHVSFVEGNSSFGSFRSQLIEHSLMQTMRGGPIKKNMPNGLHRGSKAEFFYRVAYNFRRAGINPREPFKHRDIRH